MSADDEDATGVPGVEVPKVVQTARGRQRARTGMGRRRRKRDEPEDVGGFQFDTLKAGARSFCRIGSPYQQTYLMLTNAINWDLARDVRLRGQVAPYGPGSRPSEAEVKSIKPTS